VTGSYRTAAGAGARAGTLLSKVRDMLETALIKTGSLRPICMMRPLPEGINAASGSR
jgi:hypothetical protein